MGMGGEGGSSKMYVEEERQELLQKRMVLYLFPASMESMKAHIAIYESRCPPVGVEAVDVFRGIYLPFFAKMQPKCTVPVLKLSDGTIYRTTRDIVRFVHNYYPMYEPVSPKEDEEILKFCNLVGSWDEINFSLGNPYASSRRGLIEVSVVRRIRLDALRLNLRRYGRNDPQLARIYRELITDLESQDQCWDHRLKLAQDASIVLEKILDRAEELLAISQFLFGRNWTSADSMLAPVLQRISELGHGNRIKRRVNLCRYFVMVTGRPSFQKAIAPFNSSWMRKNFYKKLLTELIFKALPYLLMLLLFILILITAVHDNLSHLISGGHEPLVPMNLPEETNSVGIDAQVGFGSSMT